MRFSTAALLTFFISTASSVHGTDSGIRGDNNARKEMTEQPDYMKSSAYRKQQVDEKLAATGVTYKDHNDSAYIKLKTSNTLLKLEEAEEFDFKSSPMYSMYKARSEELQNDVNKSTTLKEKLYLNNEKSGETTTLLKVADMDHNSEEYFQYKTSSIGGLSNMKKSMTTEEAHGAVPDILISTDVSSFNVKDANSKTFVFEELPMDTVPDDPVPTDISSGAGKESKEGGRMNNRNGKNGKNNMNNRNGRNGGNNLRKSRNGNAKIHNKVEGAEEALKLEKMFANIQKEAHEFEEKYEDLLFAGIGGP